MNPRILDAMKEAWFNGNKEYFYTFAPRLINLFYTLEGIKNEQRAYSIPA